MAAPMLRIQLADDHEIVRAGFRHLLEKEPDIEVVAESGSGKQACRDFESCQPDVLVMDISMPDISGLEAMRRILQTHPEARVLILSMHGGMVATQSMQMGAKGFICKRSGSKALIAAIRTIIDGQLFVDQESDESWPGYSMNQISKAPAALTKREIEICMQLADGRSVAEIADAMHLSEKTVYTHRQHIMDKLDAKTPVDLARAVSRLGIHA
jgi:two-component system, NarL family, invasion response regulator UvrY